MSGDSIPMPDKRRLIASFNAAAPGYQTVSVLQERVGAGLLERLELMRINPASILDLGSGPGRTARQLKQRYRGTRVTQLDIAENMLHAARRSAPRFFSGQSYVCADAELLPLAGASVDMIFSNLMLQWSPDPDAVFAESIRVLKPGGLLLFSTLGPDTLQELRESWAAVDGLAHVNTFMDMHDLGDALVRTGFADPVMEVEIITLIYDQVARLMADLKGLGARYSGAGRRRTLTGKARLRDMQLAYEEKRRDGRLPATYEVVYGHAWAPLTRAGTGRGGVHTVPLETLRDTLRGNPRGRS